MNINKINLNVAKCASTEKSRYHLNGIHFTKGFCEATNGNILARITYPYQFPLEEIPEQIKTGSKDDLKEFIIPLDGVKDIPIVKGKVRLPILAETYIDVEQANNNGTVKFQTTNLETTPTAEIRKIDGEFPDTSAVWPKDENAVFEICLDPALLKKICETGDIGIRSTIMTFTFYGNMAPVKVRSRNSETEQEFTGLIMPMGGDAREFKPNVEIKGV